MSDSQSSGLASVSDLPLALVPESDSPLADGSGVGLTVGTWFRCRITVGLGIGFTESESPWGLAPVSDSLSETGVGVPSLVTDSPSVQAKASLCKTPDTLHKAFLHSAILAP